MKLIDKTGQKFGRLTVISRASNKGKATRWNCVCECGTEAAIHTSILKNGSQISCGCRRIEVSSKMMTKMNTTHGQSRTRLNVIWREMRYRCNTPTADCYSDYGGRGIRVCKEWNESFEAFRDWAMANGYKDNLTIDREDNDGNYEPGNCRWITIQAQSNNRRTSLYLTHNGETMTAVDWSRKTGINRHTLYSRIRQGLPTEEILNPVVSPVNKPQYRVSPPTKGSD